jgi:hypothetical protein
LPINTPHPPSLAVTNPFVFTLEMLAGFFLVLGVTILVDKLGTVMFHRGFAKPFYIKGHRIHHSVIYSIVPIAYGVFSVFYYFGYVRLTWIWPGIGDKLVGLALLVALCITIDAIGDKFWPEIRKNVILHHEWIYSIIPAYLFTYLFVIVI